MKSTIVFLIFLWAGFSNLTRATNWEPVRKGLDSIDAVIYVTIINELTPKYVKQILIIDSIDTRVESSHLRGDILQKFNSDFTKELYIEFDEIKDNQIKLSIPKIKFNAGFDIKGPNNMKLDIRKAYQYYFSRIAYSKDKNTVLVYAKYDRLDYTEGGSAMFILENFWGKWRIIHISEMSAY
jgi:hypothetical protein